MGCQANLSGAPESSCGSDARHRARTTAHRCADRLDPRLRHHSPKAGTEGLRAVRELAAIVVVCTKAVEGVVDVLAGAQRIQAASSPEWGYRGSYDPGYDYEEDQP